MLTTFDTINLDIECPICKKKTLTMIYKTISIPYVGDLLLSTIICSTCKFKITDIWTVFEKGQYEEYHRVSITNETINDLVCAGSGSMISIPEIGAEIYIKTFDASHITTIEGILLEILEATRSLLATTENPDRAREVIRILENEIKNPTGRLTLIINDSLKHSAIIPHKYWVQRIEEQHKIDNRTAKRIGSLIIKKIENIS